MALDSAYRPEGLAGGELIHRYGDEVHILADPYHLSLLATLSAERTVQPQVNQLVKTLYANLIAQVTAREFPVVQQRLNTRMIAHTPHGVFEGSCVDRESRVVCVDIARAGTLPAQVCFDTLNCVLEPSGVRQDHLVMNRVTDDEGRVTGARIYGEKTGGDVGGRIVLFPDPMGATGSSLIKAIDYYKSMEGGAPKRVITMNLIITPEFVVNVRKAHPDATIYAYRLDRGLSDPDVLATVPGTTPEREHGLNDSQFIVPGAGGLGEVLNNVFV